MAINNFNVGVGTTSQLTRYRYVATGGETSISGADADGKTLSYTVGLEQVYLNGVNLVRGQDYTATNGTSIGNLTALVASDVVEVFAFVPFNIANAVTASTVDAKGDLLVGTAADTVGRLAVGTNDYVLTAASGETTGLKWAAPSGLVHIKTTSFSAASTAVNVDNVFSTTYDNYLILLNITSHSAADKDIYLRYRGGSPAADDTNSTYYDRYVGFKGDNTTDNFRRSATTTHFILPLNSGDNDQYATKLEIFNPFNSLRTKLNGHINGILGTGVGVSNVGGGYFDATTSFTGFSLIISTGDITGTVTTYGYRK